MNTLGVRLRPMSQAMAKRGLRHGVAMEVYEQHHDLEQVRGLLGHTRIWTTRLYAQVRPAALKPPWSSTRRKQSTS